MSLETQAALVHRDNDYPRSKDLTHQEIVAVIRRLQYTVIRNSEGQKIIRDTLSDIGTEIIRLHSRLDAMMDMLVL